MIRTAQYENRTLGGVRGALRQLMAEPSTRLPLVRRIAYKKIESQSFYSYLKHSVLLRILFSTIQC